MNSRSERAVTLLRAIVHEYRVERITFMAGSLAYNAFVSLLPLLFLLLAVVSALGNRELEDSMISLTHAVATPGAGDVLVSELRQASIGASILGIIVLVWGTLRIFRSLDMAFSNVYETGTKNTFTDQFRDGIVVFVSIAAVVVGVVAVESLVTISAGPGPAWIGQRLVLVCVVSLALVPMYYVFPDEPDMHVVETVPGVLFTASTLVVFQSVFSIYVEYSGQTAENSMLASILVFLTWLYFSGLVVLLGVVINAVLSNRSEDVNIVPVLGGVPRATLDGGEGEGTPEIPDGALRGLNRRLGDVATFRIVLDDGEEDVTLPAPDTVTVDTDTSPIPALNDTASLELRWFQVVREEGDEE